MSGESRPAAVDDAVESEQFQTEGLVRGERGAPSVSRERSLQSRASSVLAGGVTMVLGVAALTWYYANALTRPARARDAAQAVTARRAQGEMPLPSLGRVEPPVVEPRAASSWSVPEWLVSAASADSPAGAARADASNTVVATSAVTGAAPPRVSARQLPVAPSTSGSGLPSPDRRLNGPVFVRQSGETQPNVASTADQFPNLADNSRDEHGLAQLLRPTPIAAVQARVLPTRRLLLPKGSFIDCTLETAIDSTLPGMTTCVVATDTFSADGSVVLMERGTRLVGETRGEVQQGTARVFVLWTEARTPAGVVIPLDSPGTDDLGRAGLAGTVDRHFWERFGSAILITAIDGAVQATAQRSGGGGTVIYNPSGSQEVLTEVLKSTVNIPPTVKKPAGDRIQIFVARDVDFRSVYELRR
jgi:type IV secretion system protein VirB10